jgi:hypothetical protein
VNDDVTPTCWSAPTIVVEAEQQRPDQFIRACLVPSEPRDDAVSRSRVLDLEHGALAGLVREILGLGDYAVEPRAFESREPLGREAHIASGRREIDRRPHAGKRPLEERPPRRLRLVAEVAAIERKRVERHEGRWRFLRQLRDARRRGMEPQLKRVEIEAARRGDHELAVDDAAIGKQSRRGLVHLWEITIERAQVAALDEHLAPAAKHDRAEAVPLRLVQEAARWQRFGDPREHRRDGRLHREGRHL